MKRFKQRGTGLAMALGLFAALTCAGEVVSSAAGGWFAVDARDIKGTTLEGGVIVAGETNLVLQCSANAWGAVDGGDGATVTYHNDTTGADGTIAENTTAESVDWTPNAPGTFVLTHTVATSGDPVVLSATFAVPAQFGDAVWAYVNGGTCTIRGTGATWAKDDWSGDNPLKAYDAAITNLVVADGVTGIGENAFENMWYLQNVTLAASVTDIGDRAFKRCYGLTSVTSQTTGESSVGDYAFSGCHSLETLAFSGTPTFGTDSFTFQTAIYMKDGGIPEVYAMPTITVSGKTEHVMGKMTLNDKTWTDVTDYTDEQKKEYHFFMIKLQ